MRLNNAHISWSLIETHVPILQYEIFLQSTRCSDETDELQVTPIKTVKAQPGNQSGMSTVVDLSDYMRGVKSIKDWQIAIRAITTNHVYGHLVFANLTS